MVVQPGLCGTRSKIPKTVFLTKRLIFLKVKNQVFNYLISFIENVSSVCQLALRKGTFYRNLKNVQNRKKIIEKQHCVVCMLVLDP